MARTPNTPFRGLLFVALLLAPVACATHNHTAGDLTQHSPAVATPAPSGSETGGSAAIGATASSPAGTGAFEPAPEKAADLGAGTHSLNSIHFAFDSYLLDPPAQATLRGNAAYLSESESTPVRVEGHCDERGSAEYNLALGERRAQAAADYLLDLGVSPTRLQVVSFGEERPIDQAHYESAWASNRRADFVEVAK